MGRRLVQVPTDFRHPTDASGEPIPGAHYELLDVLPANRLTCLQVYEDVSEGTPVSPVFGSAAEVRRWLVAQGVAGENAEEFLRQGSAPSFVLGPGGVQGGGAGMVGQ
jgi:hypothetical protein